MPVIQYQGIELSKEQKEKLIREFTSIAVEITKTPAQYFSVLIQEFDDNSIGSGGKSVTEIKSNLKK
ncbi:MAG: tautomerase family protein [Bacteroidales bacterium]|nr:tautomerase family protein [Bacteroidales bacterium]